MTSKTLPSVIIFITLFTLGIPTIAEGEDRVHHITILHHNDFHAANVAYQIPDSEGQMHTIQGAAGLKGLAKAVRDSCAPSLWLFAGDEFTGTPISSITKGSSQIHICNRLGFDAAVLGNHEFDYGMNRAEAFRDSVSAIVLGGANLQYSDGTPFAAAFYDTAIGGVSVRIIGLVPPALHTLTVSYATGSLIVHQAETVIGQYLPDKERLTIVLSHMGYDGDSLLAVQVPEIDVIVGGHQHLALHAPRLIGVQGRMADSLLTDNHNERVPGTVIVQAGAKGIYLGVLSLTVKEGDVVAASGRLLPNDGSLAPPDEPLKAYADSLEAQFTRELDGVIATLPQALTRAGWEEGESPLGRWETDVMRRATGAQIAFQNPGGLRKDLNAGDLTVRDLWEANPFGNSFVIFEMSGEELHQALEFILFEGQEPLLVSGLSVIMSRKTKKASDLMVGGDPYVPTDKYKVVTNSYVFGHFEGFFGIPLGERYSYDTGIVDRIAFMEAAQTQGVVRDPGDVRVKVVD